MKKLMSVIALLLMVAMLAACTPVESGISTPATGSVPAGSGSLTVPEVPKVCLLITGNLGDRAFFDSANEGLERLKSELGDGIETKVIEVGSDQTKYGPALEQVSAEDYDVIVVMGWIIVEHLQTIAPQHPEKTYIILDSSVDYSAGDCGNVYSVEYKSNEAAFLAGALAAKLTTSGEEGYDDNNQIGFIGAIDIPVINDFMVGYIEGAQYVDPEIKCFVSYVGDFDDSGRAKELGLTQFNDGADIVFAPCSAPTIGVIDAGFETGNRVIAVDSDQAMLLEETSPEKAAIIPTSVLKNTGNSLYLAITQYMAGTLPVGTAEQHGIAEGGVGLAKNKYYEELVPQDIRDEIDALEQEILSGNIEITSAYGLDAAQLDEIRNSVK